MVVKETGAPSSGNEKDVKGYIKDHYSNRMVLNFESFSFATWFDIRFGMISKLLRSGARFRGLG